MAPMGNFKKI